MAEVGTWKCPLSGGGESEELVLRFNAGSDATILIIPPLFNEHNLMRRQLLEVMRRLLSAGQSSVLPDLPGWNESLQPLEAQTLPAWREAMVEAAKLFGATHVLTVRSGVLLAPADLPGWAFAPHSGAQLLRKLVRAQAVADQEAGGGRSRDDIYTQGRAEGFQLAGYAVGAELFAGLEAAQAPAQSRLTEITVEQAGGASLWVRSEPGESAEQADKLAELILSDLQGARGDEQ